MHIQRALLATVCEKLELDHKGVVIYGPRQSGKTILSKEIIARFGLKTLEINGDRTNYIDLISSRDLNKIGLLLSDYQMLFVDEAQRIPEIGINLKIILDNFPDLKVLVTGSSSLDLASKISEPLTGRTWTYRLFPISFLELSTTMSKIELLDNLEERLVYGSYPEIFSYNSFRQKQEYLQNVLDAYLYRDMVEFGDIKNSAKIKSLLKLIAFQVGSEVSLTELGNTLEISKDTVARYIDLLEKSYVIFRVKGFNRNLRKEVSKMDKIYFYDLGIRNILIDNLKSLSDRNDAGQLWENFLIIERMKRMAYRQTPASFYFWRTHTGAELDCVEEKDGGLCGFEFKWGKKIAKAPDSWGVSYPDSNFKCVNSENFLDFIL